MANKPSPSTQGVPSKQESRCWERHTYALPMEFRTASGAIVNGETKDLSLGGVFLETNRASHIQEGSHGTLHVTANGVTETFPVEVIRSLSRGLALRILNRISVFGMLITMHAFQGIEQPLSSLVKESALVGRRKIF